MVFVQNNTLHPDRTDVRNLAYEFTPKHHGGDPNASRWSNDLSLAEEFAVFDRAEGGPVDDPEVDDDEHVEDEDGNLYGYEIDENGPYHLRMLGTWYQQLAEFPVQREGATWHGYPVWPIDNNVASHRYRAKKRQVSDAVFDRMLDLGHLDDAQHKRLGNGDWV